MVTRRRKWFWAWGFLWKGNDMGRYISWTMRAYDADEVRQRIEAKFLGWSARRLELEEQSTLEALLTTPGQFLEGSR